MCSLAKSEGSRDNISVIVVYLKEPELIATQSWPSEITQNKDIMEEYLNPESQPQKVDTLASSVSKNATRAHPMSIKTVTNLTFSRVKSISMKEVDCIAVFILFVL